MTQHAIDRALERYGLELDEQNLKRIVQRLNRGDGLMIQACDDGSTVWGLKHGDTWLRVVLNAAKTLVITFLPPNARIARNRTANPEYTKAPQGAAFYRGGRKIYGQRKR